jgi:hypothetical protein
VKTICEKESPAITPKQFRKKKKFITVTNLSSIVCRGEMSRNGKFLNSLSLLDSFVPSNFINREKGERRTSLRKALKSDRNLCTVEETREVLKENNGKKHDIVGEISKEKKRFCAS